MNEEDVLESVILKLNALDVPYAITGALAVSFYGKPRSTHDFDLIVSVYPGKGKVQALLSAFGKDFYISEEGIIDALLHKSMFNIIHHETGLKIDLWVLKDEEYDKEAFARRKKRRFLGQQIFILSPEDMILNKLLWYKASELDKHLNDVKGILQVQGDALDKKYLKKWAAKLLVKDISSFLF
jgi:hypothetical protein